MGVDTSWWKHVAAYVGQSDITMFFVFGAYKSCAVQCDVCDEIIDNRLYGSSFQLRYFDYSIGVNISERKSGTERTKKRDRANEKA